MFLNNTFKLHNFKRIRCFDGKAKEKIDSSGDSDLKLTDQELKNINDYFKDLRSGVYGVEHQKELENLNKEVDKKMKEDSTDVDDLLSVKNEKFDRQMNEVFDLSNIPTEDGKEIDWEGLEKNLSEDGRKEGINMEELKSIVHSIYRKKGLLNEPFKVLEVDGLKLNWRQSLNNMEIWFAVDANARKGEYNVKFLPSTLTIMKNDTIVLQENLSGKVDCDGCFWTMYKNPSTGLKYVNINLTKRSPKFNNMWDQLFI